MKSKTLRVNFYINILGKIQTVASDGLNFKETEFSKNLDLGFNLNSSLNDNHSNNVKILTSPNNRNRNGINFFFKNKKVIVIF